MTTIFSSDTPVCASNDVSIVGGSVEEVLHIRCRILADPDNVTFTWLFSNNERSNVISFASHTLVNSTISELAYKLTSDRDYGAITCRADNAIGRQMDPCVFQIVPAGK